MVQVASPPSSGPKSPYRYVAVAGSGRIIRGKVKATSEADAQNLLVQRGLSPVSMEKAPSMFSLEEALPSFFKVKTREISTYSRQMATLLDSGLTLLPAIHILLSQGSASRVFKRVLEAVIRDLNAGIAYSQALGKHTTVFDEIYVRTISVGEATGSLQAILRELATHMETQEAFAKKIKGAMIYPSMILVVGLIAAFVLLTFALPPMAGMFVAMGADLPVPTKILMALSGFMATNKQQILAVVAVLIPIFIVYTKRPSGRRVMDHVRFAIPLLGPALRMSELARLSRTMSMLLNAGLILQEIFDILPQTISNSLFRPTLVDGAGTAG